MLWALMLVAIAQHGPLHWAAMAAATSIALIERIQTVGYSGSNWPISPGRR